jgi:transposase InsO family protein
MQIIHPLALFRLSVLGPLASRDSLERGALQRLLRELAAQRYEIPGSRHCHLSPKTIESWYYAWRRGGIEALVPRKRCDSGQSKLAPELQEALLQAKQENPKRSLDELKRLLEKDGAAGRGELSRSAIHRLLKAHGLSRPSGAASEPVERRAYVAEHAGDIWYGDVMHGPRVMIDGRLRKVYLVSLMDDASRLIPHSAFCLGETALDIEGVLKQALLKRGLPKKLVVDNGAAYRAQSLQGICARLEIRLIYCRPYAPEGKGKLERWHRVVRDQFLSELDPRQIRNLDDLNARLWAWLEEVHHVRPHSALQGLTPRQRWQQDLVRIRPLGSFAIQIDELFYHRHKRTVRKDGTVAFAGRRFEVPYALAGRTLMLVVDPHQERVLRVESEAREPLGEAAPLDLLANNQRKRCRAQPTTSAIAKVPPVRFNAVEQAYQHHFGPVADEEAL